ncbi:hypothetical protein [Flexithrix dorotheae]|uniref:hypothetical protein n=1 Tax=Flexithrix dorotheae TaxID=70993 RepID=UPI000373D9C0|nr:hypothetical protein [Flexithrix dorotheae]
MSVNLLEEIIRNAAPAKIFPIAFLIAWSGVPVLVYKGFPKSIINLKAEIDRKITGLSPENPGSKWPKTTLGCLKAGESLSDQDILVLKNICDEMSTKIDAYSGFTIRELSVVLIQDRTAERRLSTFKIPLNSEMEPEIDFEAKAVEKVIQEFEYENLSIYAEKIKMEGHRQSHYQQPYICSTLVYDLPANQPDYFSHFANVVDKALPGKYMWFHPTSRHITIRALIGNQESK